LYRPIGLVGERANPARGILAGHFVGIDAEAQRAVELILIGTEEAHDGADVRHTGVDEGRYHRAEHRAVGRARGELLRRQPLDVLQALHAIVAEGLERADGDLSALGRRERLLHRNGLDLPHGCRPTMKRGLRQTETAQGGRCSHWHGVTSCHELIFPGYLVRRIEDRSDPPFHSR